MGVTKRIVVLLRLAVILVLPAGSAGTAVADDAIRGAGATFPFPVYSRWATEYKRATGIDIQYKPVGSGAGIEQIAQGRVDFGASDAPLDPQELRRIGAVQFPVVIGGVVPVVNIGGIGPGELKLSGPLLARIYLGEIRKWNAPEIAALNPQLALPRSNITVVHRIDASGTTYLWSDYLSKVSPEWKTRLGTARLLAWPVGVGGTGNEGVASYVQRTRVSIGYVEFAYAIEHNLTYAAVRNRDGQFVVPGKASFEAAAKAARWQSTADLGQDLTDQPGAQSWPLTGASFILVKAGPDAAHRRGEVVRFFDWAFSHGAQAASDLDYVPLPDSAVSLVRRIWSDGAGAAVEAPGAGGHKP